MGQTMGTMDATTRRGRRNRKLRRIPAVLGGLGAAAALALGVGVFGPASSAMALHHASEWQVATAALHHTKAPSRKSVGSIRDRAITAEVGIRNPHPSFAPEFRLSVATMRDRADVAHTATLDQAYNWEGPDGMGPLANPGGEVPGLFPSQLQGPACTIWSDPANPTIVFPPWWPFPPEDLLPYLPGDNVDICL